MISEAPGGFTNRRVFFLYIHRPTGGSSPSPAGGFFTMSPRLIFHHGAAVLHREAKPNLKYAAPPNFQYQISQVEPYLQHLRKFNKRATPVWGGSFVDEWSQQIYF